jgi:predicted nucleic acid-binding protein
MSRKLSIKTRWYYDANTLDKVLYASIVREVTNRGNPKLAVLSHLALGEAYGNIFVKKGREEIDAFSEFLELLKNKHHIEVVGNDDIEDIFEKISNILPNCSITDTIHIATAIKNECSNILSDDQDINGIEHKKREKIKQIALDNGVDNFCLTRLKG